MTQDQYRALTSGEKLLYDELTKWALTFTARLDALTAVTQKLLDEATRDP